MKCLKPVSISNPRYSTKFKAFYPNATKELLVPCGKCVNCLKNYINSWVLRFELESKVSNFSYFVTLTYDDTWLPVDGVSKRDIQLYFKRLRKNNKGLEFKYCLISEYGPTTHRAHYHFLAFSNIPLDFEKDWNKGFVTTSEVLPERFVYIAKYHVIKGVNSPKGLNPTFRLCSNGLGLKGFIIYESDNVKINDYKFVFNSDGFRVAVPKYYKDKLKLPKYFNPPFTPIKKLSKPIEEAIDFNTYKFIQKLSKKSKL